MTLTPTPPRHRLLLLAAAAVALQAVVWAVLIPLLTAHVGYGLHDLSDVSHYLAQAERMDLGKWPYIDFGFEYPPLALAAMLVPPRNGSLSSYEYWFSLEMVVVCCTSAVVVALTAAKMWRGVARPFAATVAFAVAIAFAGALSLNRFDPLVGLLVGIAVLSLVRGHYVPAGLAVGLGFALKLTPVAILPLALVLPRGRKTAVWAAVAAIGAALLPFVPFLLKSRHAFDSVFAYQGTRGLQIESLASTPYLLSSLLGGDGIRVVVPVGGSLEVRGPGSALVAALSPLLVLTLLVVVYALVWRARDALRDRPEGIVLAALSVLLAVLIGNKVLSPQHLLWVLPPAALCVVARPPAQKATGALVFVAVLLTQVEFPAYYHQMSELGPMPIALVAVRNALLAAAFVVCLWGLWRACAAGVVAEGKAQSQRRLSTQNTW
jgi:hypothetical protein